MLDVVVWHDGDVHRVALDTSDMYLDDLEKGRCAAVSALQMPCTAAVGSGTSRDPA